MLAVKFPKNKADLADAVESVVSEAAPTRNVAAIEWQIAHHYLLGVREFRVLNWKEGRLRIGFRRGEDNRVRYTHEALLHDYRTEIGRMVQMRTLPVAKGQGFGLNTVRDGGVAHVILRHMTEGMNHSALLMQVLQNILKYGMLGMWHYRGQGETIGERTRIDLVPPWELYPIPVEPETREDLLGVVRARSVPLAWLKERMPRSPEYSELETFTLPHGRSPARYEGHSHDAAAWQRQQRTRTGYAHGGKKREEKGETWVRLKEMLLFTDAGPDYVGRYVVKAGRAIVRDVPYERGRGTPSPLGIARGIPTGGFYGRGWVGSMVGLNDINERMLSAQTQSVEDVDVFRVLVVPDNQSLTDDELKGYKKNKFLRFLPDPGMPNFTPYFLEPPSPGESPARIMTLTADLQREQVGQGPLYGGKMPGRADSGPAAGMAIQMGNVNLLPAVSEISDMYAVVYRSMLWAARVEGEEEGGGIPIPTIDERMIGAALDFVAGKMELSANPIPEPWKVKIDIEDRLEPEIEQKKRDAVAMLQLGRLDPMMFDIMNFRENWGLPVGDRGTFEAYRKAVYVMLTMFGDGKTPGQVVGNRDFDRADVFMSVLRDFMQSVEFSLASEAVQAEFHAALQQAENMLGRRLPEQAPGPVELAALQNAMQGGPPAAGGAGPQRTPAPQTQTAAARPRGNGRQGRRAVAPAPSRR